MRFEFEPIQGRVYPDIIPNALRKQVRYKEKSVSLWMSHAEQMLTPKMACFRSALKT